MARVRKNKDGVWWVRLYLGRDARGRAIQPYRSFSQAASREEAQALADTWALSLTAGGLVKSARLADLLDGYNDMRERNGASPNSIRSWRMFNRAYVRRWMPSAVASELTCADMNRFEQRLLSPRETGGGGLSRNSVLCVHNWLRAAFNHFTAAGVVDMNPMLSVAKPSPTRHEAASLSEWDFSRLDAALREVLDAGAGERAGRMARAAFGAFLALHTGMRCGEVCALRVGDVNRAARLLHVGGTVIEQPGKRPWRRASTKGRKGRNVAVAQGVLDVADAWERRLSASVRARGAGRPVVTLSGDWTRPAKLSRDFSLLRDELGLPRNVTFHTLRHTHATWCLAAGVDLKTLSERLGHADEATTLRLYAHVLPGRDALAADAFEQAAYAARGCCNPVAMAGFERP